MKLSFLRALGVLICLALCLSVVGCVDVADEPIEEEQEPLEDTLPISEEQKPQLSPEEQLELDRKEYLATVTYRDFELTNSEEPYYVGRWFDKTIDDVEHKVTVTDGAHLYFMIENADFFEIEFTVITTEEEPYFAYSIDGGDFVRQHISEPTVTLEDAGRHTVCIVADGMNENDGKWELEEGFALRTIFTSDDGCIVGIKPRGRVIFFYGDSITEGVRALNMNNTSDGNSATNSYAWRCAEKLGATSYHIGYGATGIINPGSFNTMKMAIDHLSKDRLVDKTYTPDVIVINHGTNDRGQDDEVFAEKLEDTLEHLRGTYPDAPIVYLIPFSQDHAQTIENTVEGIENSYVISTKDWVLTYTDGVHLDVAGARVAGELLAVELKKIFGEEFFDNSRQA